jgi:hypothetical protein
MHQQIQFRQALTERLELVQRQAIDAGVLQRHGGTRVRAIGQRLEAEHLATHREAQHLLIAVFRGAEDLE